MSKFLIIWILLCFFKTFKAFLHACTAVGMWHHAFRKKEAQGYWNVAPSLFEISKVILNRNHIHHNENRRNFTKFNTASALKARCGYSITGANLPRSSLNPILFMNQNLSVPKLKPFITCHDPFNYTCPICSYMEYPRLDGLQIVTTPSPEIQSMTSSPCPRTRALCLESSRTASGPMMVKICCAGKEAFSIKVQLHKYPTNIPLHGPSASWTWLWMPGWAAPPSWNSWWKHIENNSETQLNFLRDWCLRRNIPNQWRI